MSRTRLFAQLKSTLRRQQECTYGRREFLQISAAAVAGAMAYRLPVFAAPASEPVLILGGGAAGLAAAYTLQKAGIPFQILEAGDRVGGRIFTQYNFNEQKQYVELGGEFIDSDHTVMLNLAREFGLKMDDLRAGDKGLEPFLCYHNGKIYKQKDLDQKVGPLVKAVAEAHKAGARTFTYQEVAKVPPAVLKYDGMSIEQFLAGIPGLESWVRDIVAAAYTAENGLDAKDQSALNLISMLTPQSGGRFTFYDSDEGKRVHGGNLKLANAIADRLRRKNPNCITLEATLTALARKDGKIIATYDHKGKSHEISATRAICTLPFSVLRGMPWVANSGFSAKKLEAIRELAYGTNTKIMMEFSSKMWRTQKNPASFTGSAFGNFTVQNFWEMTRGQSGTNGIITGYLGGKSGLNARFQSLEENGLPDFEKVCPGAKGKYVKGVVYNWNWLSTAKGSYSSVGPGQYSKFFGAQWEPEWNGSLLFAGEHASKNYQSYMNGGFETGIAAAKSIVKASQPLAKVSAND